MADVVPFLGSHIENVVIISTIIKNTLPIFTISVHFPGNVVECLSAGLVLAISHFKVEDDQDNIEGKKNTAICLN